MSNEPCNCGCSTPAVTDSTDKCDCGCAASEEHQSEDAASK